jgi:DNA-binding NarL/FixJ family response regulator
VALRCLIVDDNREFLAAARELLEQEGINIVGVASTGAEAIQQAVELRPEVILVDVYLGEESGFDLARLLAEGPGGAQATVILVSTYAHADLVDLVAASPAVGFLSKSDLSRRAIHTTLGITDGA